MTQIFNLGSINIDLDFAVPHITAPGETLMAKSLTRRLGGKGANTSVALAASGANVRHYGAVGADVGDMVAQLEDFGVDCAGVLHLEGETGQAIIQVAADGENAITLLRGANWAMPDSIVDAIVGAAQQDDWLVLQNETAHVPQAASRAQAAGMKVAYAAAPFEATAVEAVLPHADLVALNRIEADQLSRALGRDATDMDLPMLIVTDGAEGATLYREGFDPFFQPAREVENVVDTTAAGDTFLGFFLGRLAQGDDADTAMRVACAASAIGITRHGAAASVPGIDEVLRSL